MKASKYRTQLWTMFISSPAARWDLKISEGGGSRPVNH